jgi:putative hemolysin
MLSDVLSPALRGETARKLVALLQRAPLIDFPRRPDAPVLGRIGSLEVRLACSPREIRRAQRLRYRVFYEEMKAEPDLTSRLQRRDIDAFDADCDHLLVTDSAAQTRSGRPRVVGTYRLLRQDQAERRGGFYSAGEFEIGPLLARHPGTRFLELGRSCVLRPYRDKRTVELLWHGIWSYVLQHRVDALFGCASLEGIDLRRHAEALSFLHHTALAADEWRVRALASRHRPMDRIPASQIDPRSAMRSLPPLIKGYLRVGAKFGDGAVVDHRFGTTDVFVVLPVASINARYVEHFGADAGRHAA